MSLKTFHIAFISCAALLSVGVGCWLLASSGSAAWGLASIAAGALLVGYEVRFVKKLKHVRYL
jgi:hypothetical protein